ncbi:MAG: hypothetical protein US30_C0011G0028 [Candidatus Moranbacteria bacterium GW2011_GWF2_36_839]|nr:MAG: hypothetical protein US27_C0011G0017 [Candidatus Moranbacteria bacterium GW2011_GWF1_36_78]KKQ16797.1 MAG: hypothetical protein US30_C0011G0028 [Candidatus Moranbacteria bacterium GW2011_GWF2_36_839]
MAEKKRKNRQMFSWMNPKLEIRDTEKYGKEIKKKC